MCHRLVLIVGLFVAAPHAYAASPADAAPVKRPATVKKVIKKVSVARLKNATTTTQLATGTTKSLLASSSASLASDGCGTDDTATLCDEAEVYYIDTEYFDSVSQQLEDISLVVESLPTVTVSGFCMITVTNGRGVIGGILCSDFAETSLTPIGVGDSDRDALAAQVESLFSVYLGKVIYNNKKSYDKSHFWVDSNKLLKAAFPSAAGNDTAIVQFADGCLKFTYKPLTTATQWATDELSVSCN